MEANRSYIEESLKASGLTKQGMVIVFDEEDLMNPQETIKRY